MLTIDEERNKLKGPHYNESSFLLYFELELLYCEKHTVTFKTFSITASGKKKIYFVPSNKYTLTIDHSHLQVRDPITGSRIDPVNNNKKKCTLLKVCKTGLS